MAPEHTYQMEEDIISKLTDDVLVLILEKVNLTTAVKASILSKRWRNLPWLLTQLNVDIKNFFHEPCADPTVDAHIHRAMSSLTEAVRSMMVPTRRKSVIAKLSISLFLTNIYSDEIGDIVNGAVENGMVKDIELISGVERFPFDVADEEMVKHADGITSFFSNNYPEMSCYLRSLILYNATFCESDFHNLLANTCTVLRYLYLYQCDTGINTLFKVDAPNSKLYVLEFAHCSWNRVEVVCLPELEQLILGHWSTPYLPLTLGCVPCLKEVDIYSSTASYQKEPFKLSELLGGTTCISSLTLDFLGQKKNLNFAQRLAISGNYLSMASLLDLAYCGLQPFLKLHHSSRLLTLRYMTIYAAMMMRRNGYAEKEQMRNGMCLSLPLTKPLPQKELKLCGFNASGEQLVFIGAVMERASNLRTVVLKEKYCKNCSAISTSIASSGCMFPCSKDEQEMVANHLRNQLSGAQIIFSHHKFSNCDPSGESGLTITLF